MVDWGFVAGRLRSLQQYLIDYDTLSAWADVNGKEGLLKEVKDSPYAEIFSGDDLSLYDSAFENYLDEVYAEIGKLIPDDLLIRLHTLTYDLNNLKIILKSKLMGADVNWEILSEKGSVTPEDLFTVVEEEQIGKLPKEIGSKLTFIEDEYRKSGDIQIADFMIDNAFNDYRFALLGSEEGYEKIRAFYETLVDMENMKNTLRAKTMNFERAVLEHLLLSHGSLSVDYFDDIYGESFSDIVEHFKESSYGEKLMAGLSDVGERGHFSVLEKDMDELLAEMIRPFRFVSSGPEVVEEYIFLKNLEVKNLKILFIGKLNNLPSEEIKKRIRNNGF